MIISLLGKTNDHGDCAEFASFYVYLEMPEVHEFLRLSSPVILILSGTQVFWKSLTSTLGK